MRGSGSHHHSGGTSFPAPPSLRPIISRSVPTGQRKHPPSTRTGVQEVMPPEKSIRVSTTLMRFEKLGFSRVGERDSFSWMYEDEGWKPTGGFSAQNCNAGWRGGDRALWSQVLDLWGGGVPHPRPPRPQGKAPCTLTATSARLSLASRRWKGSDQQEPCPLGLETKATGSGVH